MVFDQPRRTCVGCRKSTTKKDLIRVVVHEGDPVVDTRAVSPGRGAYLHLSRECCDRAERTRALARALRAPISESSAAEVLGRVREMADRSQDRGSPTTTRAGDSG